MPEPTGTYNFCGHCGTPGARKIGVCDVCGRPVCEHCGNRQHIRGEHKAVHNECFHKSGDGFSMIKIIK